MIAIDLGVLEYYNSEKNEFVTEVGGIVRFEYTLKVLYEWEGVWKKAFLKGNLTYEETVDFYMRMALDPIKREFMTEGVMSKLADYVKDSSTATTFSSTQDDGKGTQVAKGKNYTAEELYALMFSSGIPLEFENRNLNRLLVILRIISSYNNPPKKMSKADILKQNAEINAKRRAKMNTKG